MTITTSGNSTLSQDIVERILIQPLAQRSTVLGIGIQEFVSDGNAVILPALTSIGTAVSYVAEGSEIPEASVATSSVTLLPSTVHSIKSLIKMSNESISTSVLQLEAAMAQSITTRVGALIDSSLYTGAGSGGAPTGIFAIEGTNAGTVVAGSAVPADLYAMQEDYSLAFGDPESAIWLMHPTTHKLIRLMEDTAGQRVLQPSLAAGSPSTLLGVPLVVSAHCPTTGLVLADRAQLAIGRAPASITVLDQLYGDFDITALRVVVRYDIQARNAAAVVKLTLS